MRIPILTLLLLASASVLAGDFEVGWEALQRGDYATAFSKWEPLAGQGNAKAQYNVGLMYYKGEGVAQDDKQAVHWWTKAAKQGHVDTQARLGVLYDLGLGVTEDDKQAVYWYAKAAEQRHAYAQYDLGNMYRLGRGVPKDIVQAYIWFGRSAAQGNGNARRKLGILEKKMTRDTIAGAQRLAREWESEKHSYQEETIYEEPFTSAEEARSGAAEVTEEELDRIEALLEELGMFTEQPEVVMPEVPKQQQAQRGESDSRNASFDPAGKFIKECTTTPITPAEAFASNRCTEYIAGVLDAYAVVRGFFPNVDMYCAPGGGFQSMKR
jgi:TPR repeat protein